MTNLPKINDPRIDEIENGGMDEGRFFVHLKPGFDWCIDREQRVTCSFGSRKEVLAALKNVKPVKDN
jgi:hypothetical protein